MSPTKRVAIAAVASVLIGVGVSACGGAAPSEENAAPAKTVTKTVAPEPGPTSEPAPEPASQSDNYTKHDLDVDLLLHGLDPAMTTDPQTPKVLQQLMDENGHDQFLWDSAWAQLDQDTAAAMTHLIEYYHPEVADHAEKALADNGWKP